MKLIGKAFRTKEEWYARLLLNREIFKFLLKKTGDVISGSKGRQITKCRISLEILERCSSNFALVIYIKQGIK